MMSFVRTLVIFALLIFLGCEKQESSVERPRPLVTVARAVSKRMPYVVRGVGNMVAWNTVSVIPQVSGEITGVYFHDGAFVDEGQLLFTIDPSPYEAQLEEALGMLRQAEANLAYNEQVVERYQGLLPDDFVAKLTFAQYLSQAEFAEGELIQSKGAVEAAWVNLDYCWIHSGLKGKTSQRLYDPGNVVYPEEKRPLVVINQITPINVDWSVPELYLPALLKYQTPEGLPIEVEVLGEEGRTYHGILSYIGNQVDTQTGTIRLQGDLANEDESLWPGQYARVTVILYEIPSAVVIPSAAVQVNTKGKFVFVLKEDESVEIRQVRVGQLFGEAIVIEEGVKPGETVVTQGQFALGPGVKVKIKEGSHS